MWTVRLSFARGRQSHAWIHATAAHTSRSRKFGENNFPFFRFIKSTIKIASSLEIRNDQRKYLFIKRCQWVTWPAASGGGCVSSGEARGRGSLAVRLPFVVLIWGQAVEQKSTSAAGTSSISVVFTSGVKTIWLLLPRSVRLTLPLGHASMQHRSCRPSEARESLGCVLLLQWLSSAPAGLVLGLKDPLLWAWVQRSPDPKDKRTGNRPLHFPCNSIIKKSEFHPDSGLQVFQSFSAPLWEDFDLEGGS